MNLDGAPEIAPLFSRRTAIGLGIASGLALASLPSEELLGKTPFSPPPTSPEFEAAYMFAIRKAPLHNGPGFWAVAYPEDKFAGDPVLIGDPVFIPKSQAGPMPRGWGAKAGSVVVGPSAVLRMIHKVNGQDVHVTLLPFESMAEMQAMGISDGVSSWKLFPAQKLQPPY